MPRSSPVVLLMLAVGLGCQRDNSPHPPTSNAVPNPATRPATTRDADSVFIDAIVEGEPPSALLAMINAGANVNARSTRSSALYFAASRTKYGADIFPVVQAMVERGADLKARCIGGFTALHGACDSGSLKVVEYLISKGADVNAKDDQDITPLHVAAFRQRIAIIRLLVAHGADVNAVDKNGSTARDWAFRGVTLRAERELVETWADVFIGGLGGKHGVPVQPVPTTNQIPRK
jgi:hypothetical protein